MDLIPLRLNMEYGLKNYWLDKFFFCTLKSCWSTISTMNCAANWNNMINIIGEVFRCYTNWTVTKILVFQFFLSCSFFLLTSEFFWCLFFSQSLDYRKRAKNEYPKSDETLMNGRKMFVSICQTFFSEFQVVNLKSTLECHKFTIVGVFQPGSLQHSCFACLRWLHFVCAIDVNDVRCHRRSCISCLCPLCRVATGVSPSKSGYSLNGIFLFSRRFYYWKSPTITVICFFSLRQTRREEIFVQFLQLNKHLGKGI